jgi:uncharacterized protein (TIGR02444 family)
VIDVWRYCVAAYAQPDVEAACLRLQDEHGQCVPLLLWRLWACAEGRAVDKTLLDLAVAAAKAWDEAAVAPLRKMRRGLKRPFPLIGDSSREALRGDIKAAELNAERMLLQTLEAMTPASNGAAAAPEAALASLFKAWYGATPGRALAALARASV